MWEVFLKQAILAFLAAQFKLENFHRHELHLSLCFLCNTFIPGKTSAFSTLMLVKALDSVAVSIEHMATPIIIHITVNSRAIMDFGVLSPYLEMNDIVFLSLIIILLTCPCGICDIFPSWHATRAVYHISPRSRPITLTYPLTPSLRKA